MRDSPTEYLSLLRRSREQTETVLRETDEPGQRAAGIAAALRTLWPTSPLFASQLRPAGSPLHAIDFQGAERPEWFEPLETFLSRHASREPRSLSPVPPELGHAGHSLTVQHVMVAGFPEAVLLLALPGDASSETTALFWELIELYSEELAVMLALDGERRAAARRQQEFAELMELADLASLASPITHEFNNFLNTLILQLMVLANQVPEQFRADLRSVGQQAKGVAGLVRQWQQHRAQHRAAPRPLDVNAVIGEVVARLSRTTAEGAAPLVLAQENGLHSAPPDAVVLHTALAGGLPPVEGAPHELRLLLRLLITNAAATITTLPGSVRVSTQPDTDAVLVAVEDNGPPIPPPLLPRMFELNVETREGANQLEMAACEALVQRRLRGRIQGENRLGGVAVRVRLRTV
jgi:signal transduction histidine kinase